MADQFLLLDTNRDGVLSRAEWTGQNVAFRRTDVNGDRVISRREYADRPAANMEDGEVRRPRPQRRRPLGRREWPASASVGFDIADRNDDGAVTFVEYISPTRPRDVAEEMFEAMDRNNDGVLTRAEWTGQNVAFHRADINGDRVVSRREYAERPAANVEEASSTSWTATTTACWVGGSGRPAPPSGSTSRTATTTARSRSWSTSRPPGPARSWRRGSRTWTATTTAC